MLLGRAFSIACFSAEGNPAHPVSTRHSKDDSAQNGFTITKMTMPIIRSVGTSLRIR